MVRFSGSMENVRPFPLSSRYPLIAPCNCSWIRKERTLVRGLLLVFFRSD
jgi:hypothetical protein